MGQRFIFLVFLLIVSIFLLSQQTISSNSYREAYSTAEKLYNAESPTASTDSLALMYYQRTITILTKSNVNDSMLFDACVKAGVITMTAQQDSLSLQYFSNAVAVQKKKQTARRLAAVQTILIYR
jgi:hypothetical protein